MSSYLQQPKTQLSERNTACGGAHLQEHPPPVSVQFVFDICEQWSSSRREKKRLYSL